MSVLQALIPTLNTVLQSAIVIFGASIVLYNTPYILRDRITRSFALLITFVVIVFTVELVVSIGIPLESAGNWLRTEWIGIAHVPAALLHLSDVLLISTGSVSNRRRFTVYGMYFVGSVFMALAMLTDWVVGAVTVQEGFAYLAAGPLFPVFTFFFIAVVVVSIYNIWRARNRTLVPTTRRRLSIVLAGALAASISTSERSAVSMAMFSGFL